MLISGVPYQEKSWAGRGDLVLALALRLASLCFLFANPPNVRLSLPTGVLS
jgi:hypothetical protein